MANGSTQFETVWRRILFCEGEEFATISGLPFEYEVSGNIFRVNRTQYNIQRSDFERAYAHVPIAGPGDISKLVRGSAYIWAVLHDPE